MTRKELVTNLQQFYKSSMLSFSQIKKYTSYGEDRLRAKLRDVPHFGSDRKGKRYHVLDVVDVIWDDMKVGNG